MGLREELAGTARGIGIMDAHEHLIGETQRVAADVDALTLLSLYCYVDLVSAGYQPHPEHRLTDRNCLLNTAIPLEERWRRVEPHLENIRHGSYYRPVRRALRDLYGVEDLNAGTWREVTEKMRAANTPGLYHRILRERCGIDLCLVQNGRVAGQSPPELFRAVYDATPNFCHFYDPARAVREMAEGSDRPIEALEDYLAILTRRLDAAHAAGAVGCKVHATPYLPPDPSQARRDFAALLAGAPPTAALRSAVLHHVFNASERLGWVVAVHTGVWFDYRTMDPRHVLDMVIRHPGVMFDIYHLGFPSVRDCIFIAKNYRNAWLNLCWAYTVSETATRAALDEILDLVPVNKVIGFGGDEAWAVENTYGHAMIAVETLADFLAGRVERGRLDPDAARHLLALWLRENPKRLYPLGD